MFLGVDIFAAVLLVGRCMDRPGSPVAFETKLGWVLAGSTDVPKVEDKLFHTTTPCFMEMIYCTSFESL